VLGPRFVKAKWIWNKPLTDDETTGSCAVGLNRKRAVVFGEEIASRRKRVNL